MLKISVIITTYLTLNNSLVRKITINTTCFTNIVLYNVNKNVTGNDQGGVKAALISEFNPPPPSRN